MSAISVSKWGAFNTPGTSGGIVTWSIIPAGTALESAGFTRADTTSDLAAALPGDYLAQITRAFDAWSAVANVQFIGIEDQGGSAGYGATGQVADIRIGGITIDGKDGALAFAIEPGVGDIFFDTDEDWTSDLLFRVALHEIGHAIGLDHVFPSDAVAVMNPFLSALVELQQYDIAAAQAIYGAASNGTAVPAPLQYVLPDHVAELSLLSAAPGPGGIMLWGNALDNRLGGDGSDNRLSGLGGDDLLDGDAGDDTLDGGPGDDTLFGGPGGDTLDGSSGTDTASYANAAARVDARLVNGRGFAGDARGDIFTGIETLVGSNFNDLLLGDRGANALFGGDGDDNLNGLTGTDMLTGGPGDDWLTGGAGADMLNGGSGIDTASYTTAASRVDARLITGRGYAGDALGDRYIGIEKLVGGRFNDLLLGDDRANVLAGGAGRDSLNGKAGNDSLNGGAGNDRLIGGAGTDMLNGSAGNDTASYTTAASRVDARLITGRGYAGDALGDRYIGIENLVGGRFNDRLMGDDRANVLVGGAGRDNLNGQAGNDSLNGGAGIDVINGGAGDDRLIGGADNDLFVFRPGHGADRITDFAAGTGAGDKIFLDNGAVSPNGFADVLAAASQVGANTVIDLGGGDMITLLGVNVGTLAADDFLF